MRLKRDQSLAAWAVRVMCSKCGHWVSLPGVVADLDGKSFQDYYCLPNHGGQDSDCEGCLSEKDLTNCRKAGLI